MFVNQLFEPDFKKKRCRPWDKGHFQQSEIKNKQFINLEIKLNDFVEEKNIKFQ